MTKAAISAEGVEKTQCDDHQYDGLAGAEHESPQAEPGGQQNITYNRQMISRHFLKRRCHLCSEDLFAEHPTRQHRHANTQQVQQKDDVLAIIRKEGRSE